MKKNLLSIVCFVLLFPFLVIGQENTQEIQSFEEDQSLQVQEEEDDSEDARVKLSKWSLSIDAGTNAFDGDINPASYGFWKNVRGGLSLGGTIDYTFTPIVSLGLMYNYHPVQAYNASLISTSNRHLFAPILSVNLLHTFSSSINAKWGLWLFGGVGITSFKSDLYFNANRDMENPEKGSHVNALGTLKSTSVSVPLGVNFEYNFTDNLALGLKVQYIAESRDDLEGGRGAGQDLNLQGVVNDFLSTASVNVRWKFGAQKNLHTRNMNMDTYRDLVPDQALQLAKKALEKAEDAHKELAKQKDSLDDMDKRLQGVESRVGNLEMLLSNDGPDDDGDGVPNHRDEDPNTPPNTPVDFWGRALNIRDYSLTPFVFFDFDRSTLGNSAQETIFMVARKLQDNPELVVELRGYADYAGSDDYNAKLSLRRAERVKKELVDIYKIDTRRIGVNGHGRLLDPKSKYRPNRRVEFYFDK